MHSIILDCSDSLSVDQLENLEELSQSITTSRPNTSLQVIDLSKNDSDDRNEFMFLNQRLSQPFSRVIPDTLVSSVSSTTGYNLRSNGEQTNESIRDISLDCIRDSIIDLAFLLNSYTLLILGSITIQKYCYLLINHYV